MGSTYWKGKDKYCILPLRKKSALFILWAQASSGSGGSIFYTGKYCSDPFLGGHGRLLALSDSQARKRPAVGTSCNASSPADWVMGPRNICRLAKMSHTVSAKDSPDRESTVSTPGWRSKAMHHVPEELLVCH